MHLRHGTDEATKMVYTVKSVSVVPSTGQTYTVYHNEVMDPVAYIEGEVNRLTEGWMDWERHPTNRNAVIANGEYLYFTWSN